VPTRGSRLSIVGVWMSGTVVVGLMEEVDMVQSW